MLIRAAAASRGSLSQVLERVLEQTQTDRAEAADFGVLFFSNHFEEESLLAVERVRRRSRVKTLIGCNAEGVIGPEHEHEQEPTIALWLAWMPGVDVRSFHVTPEDIESMAEGEYPDVLTADAGEKPGLIVLGDPFSVEPNGFLKSINERLPGSPIIGGMASGVEGPGQTTLVLDDEVQRSGAVGVRLAGNLVLDSVVSQGCRPVGRPFVITRAERNVIHELGGQSPLAVLNDIYQGAPETDQRLMRQGVFLGRVINEHQAEFHRGDFLIRNLMGADDKSGAIAVGDLLRVGITVQFHVRDAASADEDLRTMLGRHADSKPAGALLFSCNGRGTRLFDGRDHDVGVLRQTLGDPPVAGFFCAGELGPVGGKNFIHGHTASIALFRPKG